MSMLPQPRQKKTEFHFFSVRWFTSNVDFVSDVENALEQLNNKDDLLQPVR